VAAPVGDDDGVNRGVKQRVAKGLGRHLVDHVRQPRSGRFDGRQALGRGCAGRRR
jgi:hypothetical protein